jgi:methyltransferase (TIGR00027 family)
VLQYKATTLSELGAAPVATRREVGVDLREDWAAALCAAGFDAGRPSAWLAEGLLPFLPGSAQESMFAGIDRLSADHSRVAIEVLGLDDEQRHDVEERWHAMRAEAEKRGGVIPFDPFALWYGDEGRPDCTDWFGAHGWVTRTVGSRAEAERLGRQPTEDADDAPEFLDMFLNTFVTAHKC